MAPTLGAAGSDGKLRVIVIGGSIAGLSCAHALLKSGVCSSLTVLEKARSLTAAGAGLGLDEPTCQALEDWGLRDDLFRMSKPLRSEQVLQVYFSILIDFLSSVYMDRDAHLQKSRFFFSYYCTKFSKF